MSERRINLLLWTTAALCAVGAATSLALALLVPLNTVALDPAPTTRPAANALAARGMPSLAEFEPIFNAALRPPVADAALQSPVATADAAPAVTADAPGVTLVGTIGESLALLRNARGEIELKGVGDTAGGATIVSIRTARVEMQHDGRSIVLEKPKDPPAGS